MKFMGIRAKKQHFWLAGLTLCLFLLAACGANASATGGSSVQTATATPAPTKQCGTVRSLGKVVLPSYTKNAQGVEDCFWQAYQQCSPATLVYSQNGVDTATIHTFSLKSLNGKCVITDTLQHVIFPRTPKPGVSDTCASLTQQADGLHFQTCQNEGDVVVPMSTSGSVVSPQIHL